MMFKTIFSKIFNMFNKHNDTDNTFDFSIKTSEIYVDIQYNWFETRNNIHKDVNNIKQYVNHYMELDKSSMDDSTYAIIVVDIESEEFVKNELRNLGYRLIPKHRINDYWSKRKKNKEN